MLASVALAAPAQTLGPPGGTAWLGQPLAVTIALGFEAAAPADACVQVDLLYGNRRVRAQTAVQRRGAQTELLVTATQPVDDASVLLTVRAGCGSVVTRQYTFLAEPWAPGTVPAKPGTRLQSLVWRPGSGDPGPAWVAVATDARGPLASAPVDAELRLRPSPLLQDPNGDEAQRAPAASLWQVLSARPEDTLRQVTAAQRQERALASLRTERDQAMAEARQARADLEASRPRRLLGVDVMVLVALLVGAAPGALLAWWLAARLAEARAGHGDERRASRPPASTRPAEGPASDLRSSGFLAARPRSSVPLDEADSEWANTVALGAPTRSQGRGRASPGAEELQNTAPSELVRLPDYSASMPLMAARSRLAGASPMDALADVLREAASLNEIRLPDEARRVLQDYLRETRKPSTLVFYELMVLCHQIRDSNTLNAVRRRFDAAFGVQAPSIDALLAPAGAEGHAPLMARLSAVWPTPQAPQLIEQRLFAAPVEEDLRFSLQAWRDLLWLHAVWQQLPDDAPAPAPSAASSTSLRG